MRRSHNALKNPA